MTKIVIQIPGYSGYKATSEGDIISTKRGSEKIMKKNKVGNGYYYVTLYKNGHPENIKVAQLIAMTFLGHTRNGYKIVIDHLNTNKLDDRVENLELVTHRENMARHQKTKITSSRYTGVYRSQWGWVSSIYTNRKRVVLGTFNSEEDAYNAYINAKSEL